MVKNYVTVTDNENDRGSVVLEAVHDLARGLLNIRKADPLKDVYFQSHHH